jgi:uncharacterized cupin superfamily protein
MCGRGSTPCSTKANGPLPFLPPTPARAFRANYPEPFASRMAGRDKRPLCDLFGLANFGANLTRLAPGGASALRHPHTGQDEFVYVREGRPTLVSDGIIGARKFVRERTLSDSSGRGPEDAASHRLRNTGRGRKGDRQSAA